MYLLPWLSIWREKEYKGAVYNVPSVLVELMEGERIQRSSVQCTFCPG